MTRFIVQGQHDGTYDIAVVGALDASLTSSLWCRLLDLQLDRGTFDLADCTGDSDETVAALAEAARDAEAHGGGLRVRPTTSRRPRGFEGEPAGEVSACQVAAGHDADKAVTVDDGELADAGLPGARLRDDNAAWLSVVAVPTASPASVGSLRLRHELLG